MLAFKVIHKNLHFSQNLHFPTLAVDGRIGGSWEVWLKIRPMGKICKICRISLISWFNQPTESSGRAYRLNSKWVSGKRRSYSSPFVSLGNSFIQYCWTLDYHRVGDASWYFYEACFLHYYCVICVNIQRLSVFFWNKWRGGSLWII